MPQWNAFSFLFGPLVGLLAIAVFILILRWAFSRGNSLIEKPVRPSDPSDYGLMVAVASPTNMIDAELIRRSLADAQIRATLAMTTDGPRVMVWPQDEMGARAILSRGPGAPRAQ